MVVHHHHHTSGQVYLNTSIFINGRFFCFFHFCFLYREKFYAYYHDLYDDATGHHVLQGDQGDGGRSTGAAIENE